MSAPELYAQLDAASGEEFVRLASALPPDISYGINICLKTTEAHPIVMTAALRRPCRICHEEVWADPVSLLRVRTIHDGHFALLCAGCAALLVSQSDHVKVEPPSGEGLSFAVADLYAASLRKLRPPRI